MMGDSVAVGTTREEKTNTYYSLRIILPSAMSSLPPLRSNGVFSASASCSIDAPLEKVWSIMLDFPSYKKWQEFNAYFLLLPLN